MARFIKILTLIILITFLAVIFSQPLAAKIIPVTAGISGSETSQNLITLKEFIENIKGGTSEDVKGVYVSKKMALRVVQQPKNDPTFVSSIQGVVTQFNQARAYKVTGLLAHNYSAGNLFNQLAAGDTVVMVLGDGSTLEYTVETIDQFQALNPKNPQSDFINILTNEKLTAKQVFEKYYTGTDHVIFQTCIRKGDQDSWGRLFIVAQPLP